jgi:hypothetical protein
MADIITASPTNDVTGVVKTPPTMIAGAIRAAFAEALAAIPPDGPENVVEVAVGLDTGVNLVYAHKATNGRFTAAAWIGSDWSGHLTGGAQVTARW